MISFSGAYPIPTHIQDSGIISLVAGAAYASIIAATMHSSVWLSFIVTETALGANEIDIATGPAGFETFLFHLNVAGSAQSLNTARLLFNSPWTIPAGVRIAARATLKNADIECHYFMV